MITVLLDSTWLPLVYFFILLIFINAGLLISRRLKLEKDDAWTSGTLLVPIISFFSLLLTFTLNSSANASKERTNLLHQHADAIGNLYRKSYLVDDSLRESVRKYCTHCLELKMQAADLHGTARREKDSVSFWLNAGYLKEVSKLATSHSRHHNDAAMIADEVEKIILLDSHFHYSNNERTPMVVMLLLLFGSWTIGFLLGFTSVFFKKHYFLGPVIFIAFSSLTVMAIQDMDNPHTGLIKPPYEIYSDLLKDIRSR